MALVNGGVKMATKISAILSADELESWKVCKKSNYKKNTIIQGYEFTVDFSLKNYERLEKNGTNVSYDDYLDLQRISFYKDMRSHFLWIYHNLGIGDFCGKITKANDNYFCFNKIYSNAMDLYDCTFLSGIEQHVWIERKELDGVGVGDCVSFSAEVYQYVKKNCGLSLDFGLRNLSNVEKIKEYMLPSERDMFDKQANKLLYDTCDLAEFGLSPVEISCMRRGELKQRKKVIDQICKRDKMGSKREVVKEGKV